MIVTYQSENTLIVMFCYLISQDTKHATWKHSIDLNIMDAQRRWSLTDSLIDWLTDSLIHSITQKEAMRVTCTTIKLLVCCDGAILCSFHYSALHIKRVMTIDWLYIINVIIIVSIYRATLLFCFIPSVARHFSHSFLSLIFSWILRRKYAYP